MAKSKKNPFWGLLWDEDSLVVPFIPEEELRRHQELAQRNYLPDEPQLEISDEAIGELRRRLQK